MSRRRRYSTYWRSGHALGRVPPGYGDRHARTVWFGTGEARLASLVSKDRRYKSQLTPSWVAERSEAPETKAGRGFSLRGEIPLLRLARRQPDRGPLRGGLAGGGAVGGAGVAARRSRRSFGPPGL